MNRLSQLVRRSLPEPPLRKKISGVDMQRRKELRRLKKLNIYSREFTGQQNEHGWFTPKRYKALGVYLETCRNIHPGTLPIKPELKKQISDKFIEDSHWNYYNFRNHYSQIARQYQIQKNTVLESEIATLPAHFRQQINKVQDQPPVPNIIDPIFIYNGQYNVYMPPDERQRYNLLLKIDNPPENKDQEKDQEE